MKPTKKNPTLFGASAPTDIIRLLQLIGKPLYFALFFALNLIQFAISVSAATLIFVLKSAHFLLRLLFLLLKFALLKTLLTIIRPFSKFKVSASKLLTILISAPSAIFKLILPPPRPKPKKFHSILVKPKINLPKIRPVPVLLLSITFVFATYFYIAILRGLPSPQELASRQVHLTTKIYDRNHNLLYKVYKNENRSLAKFENIPIQLRQATIAAEDKDFYTHPGISLRGILRAIYKNTTNNARTGGSTITQQLVKNALLSSEKTYSRKIKELVLAIRTENYYTKDQILEMYLNEVNYGGSAYGVEEASQLYFAKSAKDLTLSESALLAGLPASPTTYSPFGAHPELAKKRQLDVLRLMYLNNFITKSQLTEAENALLVFAPLKNGIQAPHFVMYVRSLLAEKYGEDVVEQGGLEVTTSLDLNTQKLSQQILSEEIKTLDRFRISNGAALVTNPQTGEILAMVGSKDYFDIAHDGNFNVTTALRQPGSSIKPVMYSLALENGYTPSSIIDDSPVSFKVPGQPIYTPRNYDGSFHGKVTLRTALASSYNIPAVRTLANLGVQRMIERGREMGITTWVDPNQYGLSLTLGGGEVKMTDMATAFGTIANLGTRIDLQPILKVTDYKGKTLEEYTCPFDLQSSNFNLQLQTSNLSLPSSCPAKHVLNPAVAYQLIDILSDNSARAPAFGTNSTLVIPNKHVAVKTGTSNNLKDNWTLGFTPNYLVAVWVGNNDSSSMSYVASGVTGASSIWQKTMYALTRDIPDKPYSPPQNLVRVEICTLTGTRSCPECPNKRAEYFLPGTEPKAACTPDQIKQILEPKSTPTNFPR